ncbi:hypothetical protein SAMN05216428_102326 [Nitrosospira sp. Nsp11]|uniref:hypothetical protein n=1 Tax=Nitrosospira sp. Nsp11 TaxID=1855338 RepID=UPI000915F46A|nr:hypothetical protein [Nitrosospira sp. Nsp11]SHL41389.1 hypothetical protein SAMN05216428_102326 [Nitrosospira sp. Nsp11]
MSALEALNWHTRAAEASDETILSQRSRFELVEKRPAPLEMTDTQRLDWFGEYCDEYEYVEPTKTTIGHHVIICDGQRTIDASFRDAIDLAAGKFKEANE